MYFCVKIVMYVYVVISVVGVHGCAGGLWGKMFIMDFFCIYLLGGVMNLMMGLISINGTRLIEKVVCMYISSEKKTYGRPQYWGFSIFFIKPLLNLMFV